MNTKHRMSLIVAALILSGGVLSLVNAEQPAGGPPIYTADAPQAIRDHRHYCAKILVSTMSVRN